MNWIKIKKIARREIPHDKPVLALWKGCICICEWDEDICGFYICFMPAQYPGSMFVPADREGKFTHYMVIERPEDY